MSVRFFRARWGSAEDLVVDRVYVYNPCLTQNYPVFVHHHRKRAERRLWAEERLQQFRVDSEGLRC